MYLLYNNIIKIINKIKLKFESFRKDFSFIVKCNILCFDSYATDSMLFTGDRTSG